MKSTTYKLTKNQTRLLFELYNIGNELEKATITVILFRKSYDEVDKAFLNGIRARYILKLNK